ncbi:MAG: hypothetical protein ACI3XQ_00385 [Eubacteriales bacterium]
MYDYVRKNERICRDGTEILRFSSVYPHFPDCDTISALYSDAAQNAYTWCTDTFVPRAEEEFSDNGGARARFTFVKYVYTLDFHVTYDDGSIICVKTDVCMRRGARTTLFAYSDAHVWRTREQIILPPESLPGLGLIQLENISTERIGNAPVYFSDNTVYMMENGKWHKLHAEIGD